MNACGFLGIVVFAVSCWPCSVSCTVAELISYPESNLTLPLGQASPAVFHCVGRGTYLVWKINGTPVPEEDEIDYEPRGFAFRSEHHSNGTRTTTLTVSVMTATNNNTVLNCHATGDPGPRTSPDVILTIAGPPLTPHPTFQIVNATHIQLQWDKPYAFPGYDVRSYSLITSYDNSSETSTEHVQVSQSQEYPLVHYISNGGHIPQECVHMNFTLTATNEAGTSNQGFATGGFPIDLSIDMIRHSLKYHVSFSSNFTPTLHIRFKFPKVCDFEGANYTIRILNDNGEKVDELPETAFDKNRRESIEADFSRNLQLHARYRAIIEVLSTASSNLTEFSFHTSLETQPPPLYTAGLGIPVTRDGQVVLIASTSATAGLLIVILFALTLILLAVFVMRRRKLKLRNRAHHQEESTDEAIQRATLAMVPNPIYSGNPIYDEIVDPSLLKFLRKGSSEPQSRDEGYVEIAGNPASKAFGASALPDHNKEDAYTVMNPVGSLSNQSRSVPGNRGHNYSLQQRYMGEGGAGWNSTGSNATQSNGYFTDTSEPSLNDLPYEDEERYVKGAF